MSDKHEVHGLKDIQEVNGLSRQCPKRARQQWTPIAIDFQNKT